MSKAFLKTLLIEHINEKCICKEDEVIVEQKVAFYLNGKKLLSVMTLPYEQDAHFLGFLISENVIKGLSDVQSLYISDDGLHVFIEAHINKEALEHLFSDKTLTSGCCVGVSGNLDEDSLKVKDFIDNPLCISLDFLHEQMQIFEQPTPLFQASGCTHKALLASKEYQLMSEDIGRHNAIDKVMGKAYLQNLDTHNAILLVSGRLSLEMVTKAVMHKIPIIVSKAAATFQGIAVAQEMGITLIGFARNKKYNIYTHSGRIKKQ